MLFLAVFCGFLAENQREHFVEHNREKQYMRSLIEDLETDTLELHRAMIKADSPEKARKPAIPALPIWAFSSRLAQKPNSPSMKCGKSEMKL